jgi:hypothetical protein
MGNTAKMGTPNVTTVVNGQGSANEAANIDASRADASLSSIPSNGAMQARMTESLHIAMHLVSRLCDRGISERERTNCALRARGNLKQLELMIEEVMKYGIANGATADSAAGASRNQRKVA